MMEQHLDEIMIEQIFFVEVEVSLEVLVVNFIKRYQFLFLSCWYNRTVAPFYTKYSKIKKQNLSILYLCY